VTPPEIRYPLPTLIVLIGLILVARFAATATRPIRESIAARWTRVVEGPPVPSSTTPKVVAGPVVRRVLLLKDGLNATEKPGTTVAETISKRMFADVYDVWPLKGKPEFYRIGNRHPFGWLTSAEVLPWDTRLVVKLSGNEVPRRSEVSARVSASGEGDAPCPVLGQENSQILVAVWDRDRPWELVEQVRSLGESELSSKSWGVFLSRDDLLALLRLMMASAPESTESLRLRAILGRFGSTPPFTRAEIDSARSVLPAGVLPQRSKGALKDATERLARINEQWRPDASWSSLTFQFVPLDALP
jgi:hypothetical protein